MATQSLYRRYRPQRFADLKGQDHVVRALRTAVADGREGQAYLFSGPRGTGKTSTARILAKVLNCENPDGGEPCCECESCRAVENGTSYDVHELDAASHNGVEAMRELIDRSLLGTPGRHKVYILDEVHMLSRGASAALLKTLEEPPEHVVFVLATTDPQKVLDTIRSRTQHLQFHLLGTDVLREHIQWVATDAGLEVTDDALAQVLVEGGGSARDTLSALELVAAGGGEVGDVVALDEVIEAMIDHDAGRALGVVAHAVSSGRDPRMVAEELVAHLRNRFLALMAPELVQLPSEQLDSVADQARQVGAPGLVRGIEQLGRILLEMRQAPDPRVLLDVAVVQLAAHDSGTDNAALSARLQKLEKQVAALATGTSPSPAPAAAAPRDPSTGRAKLGGRARRASDPPKPALVDPQPQPEPEPAPEPHPEPAPAESSGEVTEDIWNAVKSELRGKQRAMFSPGKFLGAAESTVTLGFPNQHHVGKCEQHRSAIEAALTARVGSAVAVDLVVVPDQDLHADTDSSATSAASTPAPPEDHDVDLDDLVDAPPEAHKSSIDRLADAFPGSELVEDTP